MANAVGESTEKISDQLTAVWNNFADGTQTLEHYADAMVKLGAYTASSSDEIAQGTEKFAAVAKMIGLDFDNAAAALATVTAQTRQSADVVGTAFRTIFARMEGLKLGETLEDGTDLNQYSQALAKVGINIKDQNGQLKDMTLLIDEIGNRWQQISRDQQVALAQTVAGVRQYAQFAALFENFDYYQELVGVAKNSEGELSKQAQIYEESWKAASKRVKASAEEIYNAIINDQMFIDLDNSLTGILHVIAQIVEAAGGLKGVFDIAVFTAFTLLGDRIATGFRNAANSAMLLVGIEQKHLRSMQDEAMTQSKMLEIYDGMSTQQGIEVQIAQMKMERQQELNKLNGHLTEEQQNQLKLRETELQLLEEIVLKNQQLLEQQQKENQEQGQRDNRRSVKGTTVSANQANQIRNAREAAEKLLGKKNKVNAVDSTGILAKSGKGTSDNREIQRVTSYLTKLQKAVGQANHESLAFNKTWKKLNQEQQKSPEILRTILKNLNLATDGLSDDEIVKKVKQINEQAKQTEQVLEGLDISIRNVGSDPANSRAFVDGLVETDEAAARTQASLDALREKSDSYKNGLEQGVFTTRDWAATIVSATQSIAGFSMAMQSLDTLIDVWSDETVEFGDKIIQTLTAIGMMLPGIIQSAKQISNFTFEKSFNGQKYAQDIATAKNALNGLQQGTKAYELAEDNLAAAVKARAAAQNLANLKMMAVMAAIMVVIAAYKAYEKVQENARKRAEEQAKKSKEIADNAKQEAEANDKLKKSLEDNLKTYKETGENKEELDNATKSLADSYNIEGAALAKLSGKYEDYEKVVKKAAEAQKNENQQLYMKNLSAASDIQNQIVQTKFKSGNWTGATLSGVGNALGGDEKTAYNILRKELSDRLTSHSGFRAGFGNNIFGDILGDGLNYLSSVSTAGIGSYNLDLKSNSFEDILLNYDALVEGVKTLEHEMSDAQLKNVGLYEDAKKYIDTYSTLIEDYKTYNTEAQKYLAISQDPFKNVKNMNEFQTALDNIKKQLEKAGVEADKIDGVIEGIVQKSDEWVQTLFLQNQIIKDLEKQYEKIGLKLTNDIIEQLKEKLDVNELNYEVLGKINFNLLNNPNDVSEISQAYQAQALSNYIDENLNLYKNYITGIQTINSNLVENMNTTQLTAIQNALEWGKNGLISFSEFCAMTYNQQKSYINKLNLSSYENFVRQIDISNQILQQTMEEANEALEKNSVEAEKYRSTVYGYQNLQKFQEQYNSNTDKEAQDQYVKDNAQSIVQNWTKTTGQYFDETVKEYNQVGQEISISVTLEDKAKEILESDLDEVKKDIEKNSDNDLDMQTKIVTTADTAEQAYKDAQEQLDKNKQEVIIQTQLQIESINSIIDTYLDDYNTALEKIANGVTQTFDENGNKIYKFTNEARQAIRTLYPEMASQLELMEDGTFKATQSMYESYFNLSNGEIRENAKAKEAYLEGQLEEVKTKRAAIAAKIKMLESEATLTADNIEENNKDIGENHNFIIGLMQDQQDEFATTASNETIAGEKKTETLEQQSETSAQNASKRAFNLSNNIIDYMNRASLAAENFWKTLNGETVTEKTEALDAEIRNINEGTKENVSSISSDDILSQYTLGNGTLDLNKMPHPFSSENRKKIRQQQLNEFKSQDKILEEYENNILNSISEHREKMNALLNSKQLGSSKVANAETVKSPDEIKEEKDKLDELYDAYDEITVKIEETTKKIEKLDKEIEKNIGYRKEEAIRQKIAMLEEEKRLNEEKKDIAFKELVAEGIISKDAKINPLTGRLEDEFQIKKQLDAQEASIASVTSRVDAEIYDKENNLTYAQVRKNLKESSEKLNQEYRDMLDKHQKGTLTGEAWTKKETNWKQRKDYLESEIEDFNNAQDEEEKFYKELYESEKENIKNKKSLFENNTQIIQESFEASQNAQLKIESSKVDLFQISFDQIQERADDIHSFNEFINTYFTQFDDVLNYGTHMIEKYSSNAKASLSAFSGYQEQYYKILASSDLSDNQKNKLIRQLVENMRNEITDIFDQISSMTNTLLELYDEVQERFDKITEDIQRRNSRLSSYQNILALQGYDSVRSKEGRAFYDQAANTRLTNLQNEYGVEQSRLAYWESQRQTALAELSKLNDSNDPQKLLRARIEKSLEEIEDNYQQSQDRMIEITQESLELVKEMYNNTLDQQLYDYEQELTGGLGFDQLQTNIDYNFEAEERYLDMVNEEYAVKEFGRKLDKAINDSQNKYAAEQYENLRDEMEQRRKNGKLSQYDLDLMNSKLEVTKAQMALEEAQNAKSTVRLVRNSAGNWDYQFTADQNKIDEAQSKYDKAVNDSYNLAKNYYKTNMQNIIALRKETYSQIEQIVKNETLTETQKEEAIKKVREQALDKYQYIMSEMKIAQKDMSEFGKATTNDYYNVFKGITEGLDLSYKSFEESFDKNTEKMKQTFSYYGQLLNSTAHTMDSDLNSVKKTMQDLTTATNNWKDATSNAIGEINSHKGELNDFISLVKELNKALEGSEKAVGAVGFTTGADLNVADNKILGEQYRQTTDENTKAFLRDRMEDNLRKKNIILTKEEIEQAFDDDHLDLLERAISAYKSAIRTGDPRLMQVITDYLQRRNNKIDLWGLDVEKISTLPELIKHLGLATGGYTGDFSGARLAFLHEKELVLNKTDTQNILSAVAAVRELAPALLEKIGQSLNGQILAGRNLMESRMSVYKPSFSAEAQPLEQNVIIQADFPGVSAAVEIEAALNNLINDATQYASVVRG